MGVPGAWRRRDRSVQLWSSPSELGLRGLHNAAPSPTSPVRRAGRSRRVRPLRVCPLCACPRTSAETSACRRQHPNRQLPVRGGRPTSQPREVSGGRPRSGPQPKEGNALPRTRAPTHRGASLAFPRVPMATAVLLEPPHLARRDGSAGCSSSPPLPPPARPYAPGLFTSRPPTRRSRAGRARSPRTRRHKLYVLSPARARALSISCTNHLTHTLMLSAVGSVRRFSAALL